MGKIRIDVAGDGAIGAGAAPSVHPVVKRSGNGRGVDKPLGLVEHDERLAALEGRVAGQALRIDTLEDEVRALVERVQASVDNVDDSMSTASASTDTEADRKAYQRQWARERRAAKKAQLPVLVPKGIAIGSPVLGKPTAEVILLADVRERRAS